MLPISFDSSTTRDFARASSREWLETNGLGGWASSTISGAHTRRYHGLLVVATDPPVGRQVILSKMEETLVLPHARVELGCNVFPGVTDPQGFRWLTGFALDPYPVFTYATEGISLRKTLAMVHGEHTLVILYELLRGRERLQLELRPFFAGRDYHHLVQANETVRREAIFEAGVLHYQPYPGLPSVHLLVPGASYVPGPDWYYNFQYLQERERGLDSSEDLFTIGVLHCTLEPGDMMGIIVSTEDPRGRDPMALLSAERERRSRLCLDACADPLVGRLTVAADQFLVQRQDGFQSILAGYHWFTDWGRDTMIALPGICLVNERFAEARSILQAFAAHVSDGMIPNRFTDDGGGADYNTVDATLWYFIALYKYIQYTGDWDFAGDVLWDTLQDIIVWHRRGTRYGIGVDPHDGLLQAGDGTTQLTWMDAKVGDWVVTPRQGKPVEINALWYNALRVMEQLAERFGDGDLEADYRAAAEEVLRNFEPTFWNAEVGCLYDVVGGDGPDAAIRPNQIFALSLPFPLLDGARARAVFDTVDRDLWTPFGLRSLSPSDPAYRPHYSGPPIERDGAYHQGTVWAWLTGPFITALVRVQGEEGRRRARGILEGFIPHLSEAGLGSVSEIFDAEPPFVPRGCVAQAWSVAELLRAYHEDVVLPSRP